jgi:hypothetical protein
LISLPSSPQSSARAQLGDETALAGDPCPRGDSTVQSASRDQLSQLVERPRVDDVCLFKPAAAGLVDTEAQKVEVWVRRGTGGDRDGDALLFGKLAVHVAEVQALGSRVQFDEPPVLVGGRDHALEVELVGGSVVDPPARGVREDREVRILEGPDDSLGLAALAQIESLMPCTYGQVEAAQQPLGQVERAVLEDLDLRCPQKHRLAVEFVVQTFDLLELLAQVPRARTIPARCSVGDREILVASGSRMARRARR